MKGLVLEGGGAKGAYQIGAYKALKDLGIEFQGVAGTSIGALNGAYIIQDDLDVMEEIWTSYDYTHFMDIELDLYEKYKNIDFTPKNLPNMLDLIYKARKNQGIDITPMKNLLHKTLNEEVVRKSKKDFALLTVSWNKKFFPHPMYIEEIENGKLVDFLIASSNLPIFKIDKLDDKLYLDGMFSENMPISLLHQKGYEEMVVIRLLDDFLGKRHLNKFQDLNIKTISPSQSLGGSLNKDKDNSRKNIDLGYLDAMKSYDRYVGVNYFFNADYKFDEDYCFYKIKSVDKDIIKLLCDILNIKKDPNLRTLMEDIIPKVGEVFNLEKDFTYKDLFFAIYEKKLEENSISRVQLYDFNKVVESINKNMHNLDKTKINNDNRIIYLQKNKISKIVSNYFLHSF
ncbi:MAG: patatin-like phospholipase family protein [Peptostreptococcaceae bacterium]